MANFELISWRFGDDQSNINYQKTSQHALGYLITGFKNSILPRITFNVDNIDSILTKNVAHYLGNVYIQFSNEKCIDKLNQTDNYIKSLKNTVKEKDCIIYNLALRYDLGIISAGNDSNEFYNKNGNELNQLAEKAYALFSRTCLEHFELTDMIQELKEENEKLEKDLSELRDKANKYILTIDDVDRLEKENNLWRMNRYQTEPNDVMPIDHKIGHPNSYDEVICNVQLNYLQDDIYTLRSLITDKKNLVSNIKSRFKLEEYQQDPQRKDCNLSFGDIDQEELRRKCEAFAQRTILDNFEQREVVNEHRDDNYYLRSDIYEIKDMVMTIYGYIREYETLLQNEGSHHNNIPNLVSPLVLHYYYKINSFKLNMKDPTATYTAPTDDNDAAAWIKTGSGVNGHKRRSTLPFLTMEDDDEDYDDDDISDLE